MDFKTIELSDKKIIDQCFAGNTYRACDFCFTNLYTWSIRFKTEFAIQNHTIFLRFIDHETYSYSMPIGKMPIANAIGLLMEDVKAHNSPFQMKGISLRMWENIQKEMPNQFDYTHDRDNDEYIYLSEKLINLSGKKLQSKRNHINRFKAENPDWEYIPLLSKESLDECAEMLRLWENLNGIETDYSLHYDYIATKRMLDDFDYLQLSGGAIKVNGRIIAFSLGEQLTQDSFVVHAEKAFGEINGAYTIINQQFVTHAASEFTYINREEDMGMENLRKAKMSYYPDILLQEGIVRSLKK